MHDNGASGVGTNLDVIFIRPAANAARERTGLIVLARYCVQRIVRDLAGIDSWTVTLQPNGDRVTAEVRARVGNVAIEASGSDVHPAGAIWNAMCRIEQPLREAACAQRYVTASTLLPSGSSTNAA